MRFKIDDNLYPKHNWNPPTLYDSGFFTLKCADCSYLIQERYRSISLMKLYIQATIYNNSRSQLLSCEEVIIKNILG